MVIAMVVLSSVGAGLSLLAVIKAIKAKRLAQKNAADQAKK